MSQDGNPFGAPAPVAPAANPYAAPQSNVAHTSGEAGERMSIKDLWLRTDGRIPRKAYWLYVVLPIVIGAFVAGIISAIIGEWFVWVYQIAIIFPAVIAGIKRMHDLDKSGWWVAISLVPLIGGLWYLYLCVIRGTEGANKFGGDPTGLY
jgi:uncharacterized membrane protein YhaH (DUF805 family)